MTLDRDDIVAGLGELAGELDAAGLELTIHVVGGAAISLEYNTDRQATSDIDAWVNARPAVREQVVDVVKQIAIRRRWPDDWLNEKAVMFIPEGVGVGPHDWRPTLEVGKVRVFVAQPMMLLAMKLRAGRGRRDLPDLEPLLAASGLHTIEDVQENLRRLLSARRHEATLSPLARTEPATSHRMTRPTVRRRIKSHRHNEFPRARRALRHRSHSNHPFAADSRQG